MQKCFKKRPDEMGRLVLHCSRNSQSMLLWPRSAGRAWFNCQQWTRTVRHCEDSWPRASGFLEFGHGETTDMDGQTKKGGGLA
jgi:hypothetical protein